jgi:HEAT repeat protein
VYDLVNTRARYPCAIPVLLELLPTVRHPNIREGIVRALGTADARGVASSALFEELARTEGSYYRWVIAYTLGVIADGRDTERLVEWLSREPDGTVKMVLARALGRTGDAAAVRPLIGLLDHPIAAAQAARAIARLSRLPGVEDAVPKLRRLERSGVAQEQSAARAALSQVLERKK